MFILPILLIIPIVWLLTRREHSPYAAGGRNPLDIARERYARGEITKEQYEQMKKDLS
jgi:putative membrane protein